MKDSDLSYGLIAAIALVILLLVWVTDLNEADCDERWAQTESRLTIITDNLITLNSNQTRLAKHILRHERLHEKLTRGKNGINKQSIICGVN